MFKVKHIGVCYVGGSNSQLCSTPLLWSTGCSWNPSTGSRPCQIWHQGLGLTWASWLALHWQNFCDAFQLFGFVDQGSRTSCDSNLCFTCCVHFCRKSSSWDVFDQILHIPKSGTFKTPSSTSHQAWNVHTTHRSLKLRMHSSTSTPRAPLKAPSPLCTVSTYKQPCLMYDLVTKCLVPIFPLDMCLMSYPPATGSSLGSLARFTLNTQSLFSFAAMTLP